MFTTVVLNFWPDTYLLLEGFASCHILLQILHIQVLEAISNWSAMN